jgi:glycosyltransferase involved in cell wall biosynthesis
VSDTLHFVVPAAIDDPARPSGGNAYDRRLVTELSGLGWTVHEHLLSGSGPDVGTADVDALADVLESAHDGPVLVDGLVASAAPRVLSAYADRRRLVVLAHLPFGVAAPEQRDDEGAMLRHVAGVVATSEWTRSWLVEHEQVPADAIRVARPGADLADLAPGTPSGGALVCVGAVTPGKGQDLLLDALAGVADLCWTCTCLGSLEVDAAFAAEIGARAAALDGRVVLAGPVDPIAVDAAYRSADALVLPSRLETYGMVVSEALARGLPVIASAVGGVPDVLGRGAGDVVPGLLVPPDDVPALSAALRAWLTDPTLRARARTAARARRLQLPTWADAAREVAAAVRAAGNSQPGTS